MGFRRVLRSYFPHVKIEERANLLGVVTEPAFSQILVHRRYNCA